LNSTYKTPYRFYPENLRLEIESAADSIKDRPIVRGKKTGWLLEKYFKFFKTARQTFQTIYNICSFEYSLFRLSSNK